MPRMMPHIDNIIFPFFDYMSHLTSELVQPVFITVNILVSAKYKTFFKPVHPQLPITRWSNHSRLRVNSNSRADITQRRCN